ncbi:sugar kinase [Actinoplanes lobatus]|uniref:Sugar kinase n=1 Tax=Actinoplanes lobatus TaxID=113568 RepID=A0A7W7HMJ6_9ACTN|nr:ROK family transcriptional regulator [Actinoplanes lobatus]MBB4753283.1 putative NBD/HSP70 family sugar kinase [Actinoplanes lobatus]GGN59474.1 sugar kinase [Actinoplanes lobatus]GIE37816.1 sugar kinase [Actinoplanes lobatus]
MTRPVHRVAPATDTPVRQDSLRAHNLILTFRQIVGAPVPISRIELATATGLTRPTISRIVDELLTAGLVVEAEPARSGNSGRPRVGLSLARTGPAGLGLDIRADSLSVCVVDLTGTVRHLDFAPHRQARGRDLDPEDTLRSLAAMAGKAIHAAMAENLTVVGATLAVPGPVDDGMVRFAPTLGWRDVDAGGILSTLIGTDDLPVGVDNDAGLAALGELYAGGPELRDFVCVSGEFDIGAGLVLGGVPLRGSRGWGGELGHVMVDSAGPACACGATGCLQCYAGLQRIIDAAPDLPSSPQQPAVAIDTLVSNGSPEILAALNRAASALGIAVSALVNLVNVDTVLLGGSYSLLTSWLTDGIDRELRSRVLTTRWSPIEVRPSLLGPDAAVIGAALQAIDQVRRDPNPWLARRG